MKEVQIIHPSGQHICAYDTSAFSISALPNGFYFMFVKTASGVYVRKVVKQ
ncbi:MAG: T9SS type A sorting domain-containing protein [Bacteroidota bacterium]